MLILSRYRDYVKRLKEMSSPETLAIGRMLFSAKSSVITGRVKRCGGSASSEGSVDEADIDLVVVDLRLLRFVVSNRGIEMKYVLLSCGAGEQQRAREGIIEEAHNQQYARVVSFQ